jgi:hypothetical protein
MTACDKKPVATESSGAARVTREQQATPPVDPLSQEATKVAQGTLAQYFELRGDTWVTIVQRDISGCGVQAIELKNVTTTVQAEAVTPADTLNGIQWKGVFMYRPVAGRGNFPNGQSWLSDSPAGHIPGWSQWYDGGSFWVRMVEQKLNGRWEGGFQLMQDTGNPANFIPIKPQQAEELAQKQEEEKRRIAALTEQSKHRSKMIAKFTDAEGRQAEISDVDVTLRETKKDNAEPIEIWLGNVTSVNPYDSSEQSPWRCDIGKFGFGEMLFFADKATCDKFAYTLDTAIKDWNARYRGVPHDEYYGKESR